ncbi:FAD-binding oxidoreductase [Mesorhizobium xinjiangense]|uniref:FAD-binding oxidoreductase n=1 Tax=Mesorhizobium xinjiangense TaxID=2678685 RepID=UPI001F2B879F|nr:FAD-binding oxidoreductase [Mesorhizobium xinjiangense]
MSTLRGVVGGAHAVRTGAQAVGNLRDWAGDLEGHALAVVRPGTVAEVQAVVRVCNDFGLPIIPQGGNTGLVGGAFSTGTDDAVVVCLDRLNTVRRVDPVGMTMRADAGCTLQQLKDTARAAGCQFPIALGSQGSCQIGGNAATNAGGLNVLRYGMARDLVLGLEVVLPDGELWNGLSALRKDNRGYDLKQLFIGSEGTLGIITGIDVKLLPAIAASATAYVGVASFEQAMALHGDARRSCADLLAAFEVIGSECLDMAYLVNPGLAFPVSPQSPVHIILEASSCGPVDVRALIENFLASQLDSGRVLEAVVAVNQAQADAFWNIRESIVEGQARRGYHVRTDLSVELGDVALLIDRARALVAGHYPGWQPQAYGHAGDGNVHFNVLPPTGMNETAVRGDGDALLADLYSLVVEFGGSISAEHGIGRTRRTQYWSSLSPVDRRLVAAVKHVLDPGGLMNPGCLVPTVKENS